MSLLTSAATAGRVAAEVLLLLLLAANSLAANAPTQPNILLIVADDLGFGELGCQGNPQIPTPHIDSLARNGIRFTSGYVTAPFCAPSRAGLLTGRNQARFGYDINPVGQRNLNPRLGLPTNEVTLANRLQNAGYRTGLVGKWHLGGTAPFHPLARGFDEFHGFLHEGHYYTPVEHPKVTSFLRTNLLPPGAGNRWTTNHVTWSRHRPVNEPDYDAHNPIWRGREHTVETAFLTDAWTREALDFIRRHQARPFFLLLAHNAPHSPMQALEPYLTRFTHIDDLHRRVFAAMLAHLDDGVGRVLAALRQLNLEEQTLIVFLSDNGGPTQELTSSNAPLSGGKGSLLEGGIRVPFILQWKGRLPAGHVYSHPVTTLDLMPTALAAAGLPIPDTTTIDGVNLFPFLTGDTPAPPHTFLHWRYAAAAAIRNGDWKLLKSRPNAAGRLFNLAEDIGETRDLTDRHPEVTAKLHAELERWLNELPDPIPVD